MNKKTTVILLICLMLLLASCTGNEPAVEDQTPVASDSGQSSVQQSEQPNEPSPSTPVESAVTTFLDGEPSAAQVGSYLMENTSGLTPEEGDLLLERLILLQQDVALTMNVQIWDTVYMTALNETMGGILDSDKIDDIADADVKAAFLNALDALMTVVRYEETPVFEMDWNRLQEIGGVFTADANDMIDFNSRLQSNTYAEFDVLAADIAAVEDKLSAQDGGFIRWQLRKIYTNLLSELFIGPEGSYLGQYADQGSDYNLRLQQYGDMYDGKFGEICRNLYAMQSDDGQTIMDYLNGVFIFPPNSPLTAEMSVTEEDGVWLSLPVISGTDTALKDTLNSTIRDTAYSLIEDGRTDQSVSTYVSVCGDFLSITFACSYLDEEGQYYYMENGLVLDLTTGAPVTLDELVGMPFESYKDALTKVMNGTDTPVDLTAPIMFSLTDSGMAISLLPESDGWPDYYMVTFNGLRSFMDIQRLY